MENTFPNKLPIGYRYSAYLKTALPTISVVGMPVLLARVAVEKE